MEAIGNILFLGAGKMASALAGGLVKSGLNTGSVMAYDISSEACSAFEESTGLAARDSGLEVMADDADVLIVAVKPQYVKNALSPLKGKLDGKLIISIAAGISIDSLKNYSGSSRVVRVMPNTPALIGQGASAYAVSPETDAADRERVERVLGTAGYVCGVGEALMDAVTGLSGSGPAYVFDFIQALADGGVCCGIPRAEALQLAARTVAGAAAMVLETGMHPALLRDQVTSPGGTTARGLKVLEENAFRGTVINAVSAAAARSAELGGDKK